MKNKTHYIRAGWMIDGSGSPVQKRVLLAVDDGIITDISEFCEDDCPDASLITDLSRCTILPPLTDAHVHLAMSSSIDPQVRKQQLDAGYEECKPRIAEHIHYLFSYGVLAVRDAGDRHGYLKRYKAETENSGVGKDPVVLKTAGRAWHKRGRYGSFIGKTPLEESLETAVAGDVEFIDHIKLINSGLNSLTDFGKETRPQFSLEEIRLLVELGRRNGKKVMVHANGNLPVKQAVQAGCHSIEHGFFMGDENLQRMADSQTMWVPTAVTMKALLENWQIAAARQGEKRVIAQTLEHQLGQMARAKQYGVRLALGTDAGCSGILHGESVVDELKLFMKAGYSLVEAVQCASANGAELLGVDGLGSIARGKPAHFIVARATPAMLPRKLSYLEAVYLNGTPCDKAFFNKI